MRHSFISYPLHSHAIDSSGLDHTFSSIVFFNIQKLNYSNFKCAVILELKEWAQMSVWNIVSPPSLSTYKILSLSKQKYLA